MLVLVVEGLPVWYRKLRSYSLSWSESQQISSKSTTSALLHDYIDTTEALIPQPIRSPGERCNPVWSARQLFACTVVASDNFLPHTRSFAPHPNLTQLTPRRRPASRATVPSLSPSHKIFPIPKYRKPPTFGVPTSSPVPRHR